MKKHVSRLEKEKSEAKKRNFSEISESTPATPNSNSKVAKNSDDKIGSGERVISLKRARETATVGGFMEDVVIKKSKIQQEKEKAQALRDEKED